MIYHERTLYSVVTKERAMSVKRIYINHLIVYKIYSIIDVYSDNETRRCQEFLKLDEAEKYFIELQKILFNTVYFSKIEDHLQVKENG